MMLREQHNKHKYLEYILSQYVLELSSNNHNLRIRTPVNHYSAHLISSCFQFISLLYDNNKDINWKQLISLLLLYNYNVNGNYIVYSFRIR